MSQSQTYLTQQYLRGLRNKTKNNDDSDSDLSLSDEDEKQRSRNKKVSQSATTIIEKPAHKEKKKPIRYESDSDDLSLSDDDEKHPTRVTSNRASQSTTNKKLTATEKKKKTPYKSDSDDLSLSDEDEKEQHVLSKSVSQSVITKKQTFTEKNKATPNPFSFFLSKPPKSESLRDPPFVSKEQKLQIMNNNRNNNNKRRKIGETYQTEKSDTKNNNVSFDLDDDESKDTTKLKSDNYRFELDLCAIANNARKKDVVENMPNDTKVTKQISDIEDELHSKAEKEKEKEKEMVDIAQYSKKEPVSQESSFKDQNAYNSDTDLCIYLKKSNSQSDRSQETKQKTTLETTIVKDTPSNSQSSSRGNNYRHMKKPTTSNSNQRDLLNVDLLDFSRNKTTKSLKDEEPEEIESSQETSSSEKHSTIIKHTGITASRKDVFDNIGDDDLWDDDLSCQGDDDSINFFDASPTKKTQKIEVEGKTTKHNKKPSNGKRRLSSSGKTSSTKKSSASYDEDPYIDENKLKPDFPNHDNVHDGNIGSLELSDMTNDSVPYSMNRYLMNYQREGVKFLYQNIFQGNGAILGDDMGLGKTVQLIALFAALLRKKGTGLDLMDVTRRRKLSVELLRQQKRQEEHNNLLAFGITSQQSSMEIETDLSIYTDPLNGYENNWAPILVIVPPSVIANWENELTSWGHFFFETFTHDYEEVIEKFCLKRSAAEILICGDSRFAGSGNGQLLYRVDWKLIIVDEYHGFKNNKSERWKSLYELQKKKECPIIGMTGTAMPNKHRELYNLINLTQPDLLGSWDEFERQIIRPIKLGSAKDAKGDLIEYGKQKYDEFHNLLEKVYLSRKKKDVLKELPKKNKNICFCELTSIQKEIYQHIITLPDYMFVRHANVPCDCGVNQAFFSHVKRIKGDKARQDFIRKHKRQIIPRKKCCYRCPFVENSSAGGERPMINPRAVLWRRQHENDEECMACPGCISFSCLHKLYLLCTHPSLLMIDTTAADNYDILPQEHLKNKWMKEFVKVAIPHHILPNIPERSNITDDHHGLSGKLKALDLFLKKWDRENARVLLFSQYTTTLDIIESSIKSKHSFLRLDGQTPTNKRQPLVDEFQNDERIFLFLISTRAGGLGLNLTAANKVIIFDVSWNPSSDDQAEDRAYRIGQKQNVEVVRLVARGTIEESMYMRQLYKNRQSAQIDSKDSSKFFSKERRSLFRGVQGEKELKGELFGLENLLNFKDGSYFLDNVLKGKNKNQGKKGSSDFRLFDESTISERLGRAPESDVNQLIGEEKDDDEDKKLCGMINELPNNDDAFHEDLDTKIQHDTGEPAQQVQRNNNNTNDEISMDGSNSEDLDDDCAIGALTQMIDIDVTGNLLGNEATRNDINDNEIIIRDESNRHNEIQDDHSNSNSSSIEVLDPPVEKNIDRDLDMIMNMSRDNMNRNKKVRKYRMFGIPWPPSEVDRKKIGDYDIDLSELIINMPSHLLQKQEESNGKNLRQENRLANDQELQIATL